MTNGQDYYKPNPNYPHLLLVYEEAPQETVFVAIPTTELEFVRLCKLAAGQDVNDDKVKRYALVVYFMLQSSSIENEPDWYEMKALPEWCPAWLGALNEYRINPNVVTDGLFVNVVRCGIYEGES